MSEDTNFFIGRLTNIYKMQEKDVQFLKDVIIQMLASPEW